MISPGQVQGDVIDIRSPLYVMPSDLVLDANVLYWLFYDFTSLTYARGRPAVPRQQPVYEAFVTKPRSGNVRLHVTALTLGEFIGTVEHADLEAIWRTDAPPPQPDPANPVSDFSPRVCKFARYHYDAHLRRARTDVEALVTTVLTLASLLPSPPTAQAQHASAVTEWLASRGDFPDAALVAAAKHNNVPHVLSDDADLATFAGLTLYTANQRTISAARAAGKLR